MNRSAVIKFLFGSILAIAGWVSPAQAQVAGGAPGGMDTTLMRVFGQTPTFTTKADARVLDKDNKETLNTPMTFMKLDDRIRVDVDLTQIKGPAVAAADVAQLKALGLHQVSSVTRLDKRELWLIYPAAKAYIALPISDEEAQAAKEGVTNAVSLGQETIDGQVCEKRRFNLAGAPGQSRETVVWNAVNMKGFPIQIRTMENNTTMVLRCSQIQLSRPDAKQFDPPSGFKRYGSMQDLVQARAAGGKSGK